MGLIGKGAYSRVHKAVEKNSKAIYAVKIIRKVVVLHKQSIAHLRQEVSVLSGLNYELASGYLGL